MSFVVLNEVRGEVWFDIVFKLHIQFSSCSALSDSAGLWTWLYLVFLSFSLCLQPIAHLFLFYNVYSRLFNLRQTVPQLYFLWKQAGAGGGGGGGGGVFSLYPHFWQTAWVTGVIGSHHLNLDPVWQQQNQRTHCTSINTCYRAKTNEGRMTNDGTESRFTSAPFPTWKNGESQRHHCDELMTKGMLGLAPTPSVTESGILKKNLRMDGNLI